MSIDIRWYDDTKRIVYYNFHKGWNWEMIVDAFKEAKVLSDSVEHEVDCIMDFSGSGGIVPNGALSFARYALKNEQPSNMNRTIIVGTGMVRALGDIANTISRDNDKWKMHFTKTLDDALNYLTTEQS